jgi:putative addiction module component (TIGR02574 family)
MQKSYQKALQLASSLAPEDKLQLIAALSQQLVEPREAPELDKPGLMLPPEALAELSRRMEALEKGEANTIPWKEVMAYLQEKHR